MNSIITPDWVSTDVAVEWDNNNKALKLASLTYGNEWKNLPDGAKIGDTVRQRIPQRFRVKRGQALQQQPILNETVPISLTDQLQVAIGWSSSEQAIEIEEAQTRYTKPAGRALSAESDRFFVDSVFKSVWNSIGTPGTRISDNETWTDGVAKLHEFGVPDDLLAVVSAMQQSKLQSTNLAGFNPQSTISTIFRKGFFGFEALGVSEWAWDSNLPSFTTGTFTSSTPVVSGADQSGSSLAISGMGTYALKEGDRFTISAVYGTNPISYVNTNVLYEGVLTADVSGSSTATLSISPPLIADTNSQLQSVNALPANGAAISFKGSTGTVGATMSATTARIGLIANTHAFAFVSADLPVNLAGAVAGRTPGAKTDRVSIRYVDQYGIETDQLRRRMDALVGAAPVMPGYGLAVYS